VSEYAGGATGIPARNRPAVRPLLVSDIDMKHRSTRVRRLKGSLETTQPFVEHRGKPALSDYACLKAYLALRIDDSSGLLCLLNSMLVKLLTQVSDARLVHGTMLELPHVHNERTDEVSGMLGRRGFPLG
jgi:hypothetical protein